MKDTNSSSLFITFCRYVLFNVTGMVGLSCYILADTLFIARGLGPDGLTALNLAIPVYSFIHGTGLMAGMGGGTRYSIQKAAGNTAAARRTFTTAVIAALALSFLFVLSGAFGDKALTSLLHADSAVFGMTRIYLKVILLFAPAFMLNNVVLCFVRNDGNPNLSMAAMLAGSFSNVILDYVFIFPLGMGIFGAVIATSLAPLISLGVLSLHLFSAKSGLRLARPSHMVKGSARLLSLGLSSFIAEAASGIVMITFNFIILSLKGNLGVAAYGIIANLSLVVTSIYTGIAQGSQPLLSEAHGAGRQDSIRRVYVYAIISASVFSLVIYSLLSILRVPVIGLFNHSGNGALAEMAGRGIILYFTAFLFVGINIISAILFSSVEQARLSFSLAMLRGIVLLLPLTLVMSRMFGMTGVWLSFPVTEMATCIVALLFVCRHFKKQRSHHKTGG
ncbi:MATE family efflux transporter [Lachnospiraceae bacterium]|uniref:MATE family efflux transporter n=1 Tax=Extibacter sp. GGCC_0201 TaxID=2731209 RepID=UPI001AA1397F|nr:MATE family efflux transporter [Extibacter sp. GGCC_0201]MBO1719833.1 MATE family efflux transporter [Extibacter sp. GGCC_0201]BDF35769.1 MATE family efflux transporter [Lachnospiraceae bacterium]BDF39771.1 MATE family efflux transporter [Lachnospiraceae bacterium]